jgi:4-hydroxy-4-methyl-2-oxoglutarate aldolase
MTKTTAPLTAEELGEIRALDCSTLFFARAAVEGFISEDFTGPEIRCMYPEMGSIVGYAVTSEWTTMDPESPDLDFLDYYEWVEAQPGPKVAVMMDVDPRAGRAAALGSMQARTLRRLGVGAIVSSVAVQKPEPVRAAGMPVWSTGVAAAHGPYHVVRYGAPVQVGRVGWHTGDLVFADAAGAIRIPVDLAREVLAKVKADGAEGSTYFDVVDAPGFTVAKLREWAATHESIYPPVDPAAAERWWAVNGGNLAPRGSGVKE